jgi:hypothetical protein
MVAMNGYLEGTGGLQTSVTTDPLLETWHVAGFLQKTSVQFSVCLERCA